MLRAWRHRQRLRNHRKARVWLFTIAANLWRDEVRRATWGLKSENVPVESRQDKHVWPDQQLLDREDVRRALNAMDRLPQRQREVLYLHACESLSLAQIADVLKISADAVKASVSLARKKMRQELEDLCPDRSSER